MSDRLKELQHQRALAQEQLAWLDREIAREAAVAPVAAVLPEPRAVPVAGSALPQAAVAADLSGDLISRYNQEPAGSMAQDAKRGCLIAFAVGMAALTVLVVGGYLIWR